MEQHKFIKTGGVVESAKSRAEDIMASAKEQYKTEIDRLKLFNARWSAFINQTVRNYPSDKTRKLAFVSEMITEILSREDTPTYTSKEKLEEIYKIFDGDNIKVEKQKKSLYGESETGFNMEDVLNPKGELDLMSLCKELGVTD